MPVGLSDAVEGFGEDDGQDGGSDAGNGAQDVDGLSAFHCLDPVEDLFDLGSDLFDFGVERFEPVHVPLGGVGDGLDGSGRRFGRFAFGGDGVRLRAGQCRIGRSVLGIRPPRRPSDEDAPRSWQVGFGESSSRQQKLAFLRREVQFNGVRNRS